MSDKIESRLTEIGKTFSKVLVEFNETKAVCPYMVMGFCVKEKNPANGKVSGRCIITSCPVVREVYGK